MKKTRLPEKKMTYRIYLWVCLLALIFCLSGCSQVFANNPVVQQIQKGESEFDFSLFDPSSLRTSSSEEESKELLSEPELEIVPTEYQLVFDSFLHKVQSSQSISYRRALSFSEGSLETNGALEEFLASSNLQTIEQKTKFVMDNEDNQRALFDSTQGYLINKSDGTNQQVSFGKKDRRHLLSFLCDEATLEILSVETESAGNEDYLVFNLTENSQISKWYFNKDGTLFLRMFLDHELLYAIKYDQLEFDVVFDESTMTPQGYETALYKKGDASAPGEALEESSAAESSSPESSVVSAPPKDPVSTPGPTPESKSSSALPPASASSQKLIPEARLSTEASAEASGENLQGYYGSDNTTSSKTVQEPSQEPVSRPPIKEFSGNNVPSNFVDYPSETLPIIYGYNIINSSDVSSGGRRTIMMAGTVSGSAVGTSSYYEQILEGSTNYKTDEKFSESDEATYYTISARRHAWDIDISITEDHNTLKTTLEIRLDQ